MSDYRRAYVYARDVKRQSELSARMFAVFYKVHHCGGPVSDPLDVAWVEWIKSA